jgi:hypothetical protein
MTKAATPNIAIFPASLLPIASELKTLESALPSGSCLIVPPARPGPAWDALVGFAYHELDCHGRITEVAEVDSALIESGVA